MNEKQQDRNYYMIRPGGERKKLYDNIKKDKVIGVGWWWDLAQACQDEANGDPGRYKDTAKKILMKEDDNSHRVGRYAGNIERFLRVKEGDRVVVPIWDGIWLGEVTKGPHFNEAAPYDKWDMHNQVGINYRLRQDGEPVWISKPNLPNRLQTTMTGFAASFAVRDLRHFKEEIEELFNLDPSDAENAKKFYMDAEKSKHEKAFKEKLLRSIKDGENYLQAGGRGLEKLIEELLKVNGYTGVEVLSRRFFPNHADADVIARKDDGFVEEKFLVQVKHHKGQTNDWGVRQLEEIKNSEEYGDYKLYLISSGEFSKEVTDKADELDINLIDGEGLVHWIYKSLSRLGADTKRTLKIVDVPSVVD